MSVPKLSLSHIEIHRLRAEGESNSYERVRETELVEILSLFENGEMRVIKKKFSTNVVTIASLNYQRPLFFVVIICDHFTFTAQFKTF